MNTKIYTLNEENIDTNIIKEAGEVLKKGGLVAYSKAVWSYRKGFGL